MKALKRDDVKGQAAYKKQLLGDIEQYSKTEHTDLLQSKQNELQEFVDWQSDVELEKFEQSTKRQVVPPPRDRNLAQKRHTNKMQGFKDVLEHYKLELRKPNMQPKDADMKPKFYNYYTPFPNRYTPSKDGKFSDEYWGAGQSGKWTKPII
tara:strand:- start:459 stop:911 length:453 start_codon:yes stop_codon:yes gene_type:complete